MSRLLVIVGLALLTPMGIAQGIASHKGEPLDDAQLDRVTAGGVTAGTSNGVTNFQGQTSTPNGLVSATGSLRQTSGPISGGNMSSLSLNGSAQQNLSSILNLNAVNSAVNVLMNLNINIDSTVGTLTQTNMGGGRH